MNKPTNYLSCDNVNDAIRSLAIAYNVTENQIRHVYEKEWPDFLPEDSPDSVFTSHEFGELALRMSGHLKSNISNFNHTVAYYHRCLYNGDSNWFKVGLLNSVDGTDAFLEHLRPHLKEERDFELAKNRSHKIIERRSATAGTSSGGPHAFDVLACAKGEYSGDMDYSIPEFLIQNEWDSNPDTTQVRNRLTAICKKIFKPVVVKFLDNPRRINERYLNSLWYYLHLKRFIIEAPVVGCAFLGQGRTVPYSQFIEIISLNS